MRPSFAVSSPFLKVFFLILGALLCLVPFFASVIPPITDVSHHVLVARIIDNYNDAALKFADHYLVQWHFVPADLLYVTLSVLQKIFGPYGDARAYLVIWVALLASSVFFLARRFANVDPWLAALLSLPLSFCWFVWMGFLPFILTFPLFCFALGVWLKPMPMLTKIAWMWLLLTALYAAHVVGFCAAAAALAIISLMQARQGSRETPGISAFCLAIAPTSLLLVHYLFFSNTPRVKPQYGGLYIQIYDLFHYTWATLTGAGRLLLIVWVSTCLVAALKFWWQKLMPSHVMVTAALFAFLGILIPLDLGGLWPAGSRLFPYLLLLLIAATPWPHKYSGIVTAFALSLLVALSAFTTKRVLEIDVEQRQYLRVADEIKAGSRVLSIFGDLTVGGANMTWPFVSLVSAATVLKGGINPFTYAIPFVFTGATPISYRNTLGPEARSLFEPAKSLPAFVGISAKYDYVISRAMPAPVRAVIEAEFKRVQSEGVVELWVPLGATHSDQK